MLWPLLLTFLPPQFSRELEQSGRLDLTLSSDQAIERVPSDVHTTLRCDGWLTNG
jgi:hypothetical protein